MGSSVETSYAGNLFRSRLEARWAVFLTQAGIGWAYEPAWLHIAYDAGLTYDWRPDFRLADGRWAEVKGMLTPSEHERLLMMASAVSRCGEGVDVVVLGHLPDDDWHWPIQLHDCAEQLWAVPWTMSLQCPLLSSAPRVPGHRITAEVLLGGLLSGQPNWAEEPLDAARSARFG